MENLQGLPYSRKDGPTVQFWPAHEQTGHGLSNLYQDTPQVYLERRPSSSVADQSASATHDLPSSMNSLGQLEDSNRGVNWANAWTWDSFSLTAQLATNGTDLHKGSHARVAPQSQLDSPSPDKSEMNGEPILLEFGLNTMGKKGNDEDGLLDLKLGANGHYWEADEVSPNSKRSRHLPPDSQQTRCQVDTCTADLQNAKDYHRRHKVCEFHAKAPKALVGRVMQRFCQQCSRFHLLKEFDDDRRSCRKRLAGHNRRRRKAQPDPAAALASLLADQSILSRIIGPAGQQQGKDSLEKLLQEHALIQTLLNARVAGGNAADNKSQATDASVQSSLLSLVAKSQLLGNLLLPNSTLGCELPPAPVPAPADALITALSNALLSSLPQLLQKSNGDVGLGGSIAVQGTGQIQEPHVGLLNADAVVKQRVQSKFSSGEQPAALLPTTPPVYSDRSNDSNGDIGDEGLYSGGRHLTNGNKGYIEGSGMRSAGNLQPRGAAENREPIDVRSDTSTPPMADQPERSAGGSDHSLDSGFDKQVHQGKVQTYQLWFKIFDKGPADFPPSLRDQMLDWLNHLPDLEGHIRPGCVILSVFVCMPGDAWDKLCCDIKKSLEKLVSISDCDFWRRGRVLVDLGQNSAFIMDGKVYTNTRPKSMLVPNLILVQPFSVVVGETVDLTLRGQNLRARGTKAICAYDGKCAEKGLALPTQSPEKKRSRDEASRLAVGTYVVQEEEVITCTIGPFDTMGRGFIEVEGQSCNGNAFPIVIADRPICEELSCLEREYVERIESKTIPYPDEADITHFLHELGWLLQRVKWKARNVDLNIQDFAPARYRWLLRFSVEHGCRAVVKRVLDLLFSAGHNHPGSIDTIAMDVLSEANLLHVAVKSNSPPMVEFLLTYAPPNGGATSTTSSKQDFLFRPDAPISDGLTCLHIAASMHAADDVIDALTDAPDEHWAVTWVTAKDSFGKTPLMHALASGNYGYVKMVQSKLQKIGRWSSRDDVEKPLHLALSIDANDAKSLVSSLPRKLPLAKQIEHCTCRGRELLLTRNLPLRVRSLNMYRPFMLMMLAVAAVCVCVGVLMKGPPHVSFLRGPFVWEAIGFGTM